jgi:hypothetical protein
MPLRAARALDVLDVGLVRTPCGSPIARKVSNCRTLHGVAFRRTSGLRSSWTLSARLAKLRDLLMGARCQHYFEEANKVGGLVAKMRLASIAQITSMEAGTVPDSTELTVRLDAALARVRGEFASPDLAATAPKGAPAAAKQPAAAVELLRRYLSVIAELFSQRSLFTGDLDATVRRMTETACSTLDVERVSVWFLDAERTKIVCADLFQRKSAEHSSGVELMATDFAPYFEALATKRPILAHDANKDPRTSCFSEVYLQPLGIGALLDVPIWAGGEMVGVICHEHVGGVRNWTSDEESFAHVLAGLVSVAFEQRGRARAAAAPAEPDNHSKKQD